MAVVIKDTKQLGALLRRVRRQHGLTQIQLAAMCGVVRCAVFAGVGGWQTILSSCQNAACHSHAWLASQHW